MNSLTVYLAAVVLAVSMSTTSLSSGDDQINLIGPPATNEDTIELIGPPPTGDGGGEAAVRDTSCNACSRSLR